MRLLPSYKTFTKLVEQETFEPVFSWGLRMAIAAIVPVLWGLYTERSEDATWIALTAESICWVELKGSFGQRLRILTGGIMLSLFFGMLGSVTGDWLWLSLACMLLVGFISGLFKNLGDRGSGLAMSVFVLFIITNNYPTHSLHELQHRVELIFIGGLWNALVGIAAALYTPAKQPYRRTIAVIWKSIHGLIDTVAMGWDGKGVRSNIRDIYLQEKEVRAAIDTSLHLYEAMAHQANKKDTHEYELAQVRKATALVATHIIAISEELEQINIRDIDTSLRLKIYAVLKALQQTVDRMAVYVVNLKPEEELLLESRISRLDKLTALLKEYYVDENDANYHPIKRTIQLAERCTKLIQSSMERLEKSRGERAVFRSYSLIKTIFILHPKHWIRNLQVLFNFNTFTTRYAIRAAVAATIGLFISKWFNISHGYWLPFTTLLVLQPYFGATIKKAIDRVIGTVAGGIAGGLIMGLPTGLYIKEIMLFISFIMMVYFIHKRYAVAVFFITLSLVMLFNVEGTLDTTLLITRGLSTVGGATLAIIAGFALLPHWDTKWLPIHLSDCISANYQYFRESFFADTKLTNWTRMKRNAESKNTNAFDSFNRYMQEPSLKRKTVSIYYHIITHNVRITRELNNIHLEEDNRHVNHTDNISIEQKIKLHTALTWFNKNVRLSNAINLDKQTDVLGDDLQATYNTPLSETQLMYLDRMIIELKAMHTDMLHLANREKE